jgi:hypothetical protein
MQNTINISRRSVRRLRFTASKWRKLVSLHAEPHRRTSASERERYEVVYRRLIKVCDDLAQEKVRHEGRSGISGLLNWWHTTIDDRALEADTALTFDTTQKKGRYEMIRQLSVLIRPWVSPKSIHNAPKAIVKDLLAQQRALEERITGSSSKSFRESFQPIFLMVAGGVAVGLFVTLLVVMADSNSFSLENMSYSFMSSAHQLIIENQVMFIAVLAWLFGTMVLWSAFRH